VFLVSLALPASVRAADGSGAPRLAWQAYGGDIDFSPDGQLVAVTARNDTTEDGTTRDGVLQVRRAATGEIVSEAEVTGGDSGAVRWSPAGDRIAVTIGSVFGIWAWDGASLRLQGRVDAPGSIVPAWSRDGRWIVTAAYETAIHVQVPMQVWDTTTWTVVATFDWDRVYMDLRVYWTTWSPTGDVLFFNYAFFAIPDSAAGIAAWDIATGDVVWYRDGLFGPVLAVSPDGTRLAALSREGGSAVTVLDALTGDVEARRTAKDIGLKSDFDIGVTWSADGRVLYVGVKDGKGVLLTYPSLDVLSVLNPSAGYVHVRNAGHAIFSSDDRLLALGKVGVGLYVYIFDLAPPPDVFLIGGVLAVAGGGVAAVGYAWRRRRRRNAAGRKDGS
jgi:WD40 repeat protein